MRRIVDYDIYNKPTRQPFITVSSAEARLVSMVHSLQMSDSILPVIEELVQVDVKTALLADSVAALASFARPAEAGGIGIYE